MVINRGEIVHIVVRRQFDTDQRRHFVGRVSEVEGALARVIGYSFVYDDSTLQFVRRSGIRTRVVGLIDPGLVIHVLPADLDLEDLRYETNSDGVRVFTDGKYFQLDASEFGCRL